MPAFVAGDPHLAFSSSATKTWMVGTSPAMTMEMIHFIANRY